MNYVELARGQAAQIIADAYRKACENGLLPQCDLPAPIIEIPKDLSNGDYASTFAMRNSKALGKGAPAVAQAICGCAELEGSFFSEVSAASNGFINLRLSHLWFEKALLAIHEEGENYGRSTQENPLNIMVEFVSANPTGPMHMGNARGGVLGDALAEVLSRVGHRVTREFYVNDAGNQIDKFARSIEARYFQLIDGEDSLVFPEDGYQGEDIKVLAALYRDMHGDALKNEPAEKRLEALGEFGISQNLPKMKLELERYGIVYDNWFYESSLYSSGAVERAMDALVQSGHTYESEGALWLKTTDFGCEKDDVLRRANGFYTYFAADIAYHSEKLGARGFDIAIDVWGADHHGHVARLKAALDALGLDGARRLEIVLMQLVRLTRNGEVVRMSKRTGKAIALNDLLDEISVDAARYFFSSRAADTHLEFDLDLAVRQNSENPVYYVQYAHARCNSILKNLSADGIETNPQNAGLNLLVDPAEADLIRELAQLPEEIRLAADSRDPSRLTKYATQVAAALHRFYTECRIKEAEEELRTARIYLINCVATVVKNTLSAFGVTAPDHM